jgi:hypothetical protein
MTDKPKPAPLADGTTPKVLPGQMTVEEVVEHVDLCNCPMCRITGGRKSEKTTREQKSSKPLTAAEAVARRLKGAK